MAPASLRTVAMLFVAVVTLSTVSCSFAPAGGVPLASNDFGRYSLLVNDASGLVTGARGADRTMGSPDGALVRPGTPEIEIGWTGGACSHQPVAEVTGSAVELRINIRNPHDPQPLPFLPVSCPAVGIPLSAVLVLSEPIDQAAIRFEVSHQ